MIINKLLTLGLVIFTKLFDNIQIVNVLSWNNKKTVAKITTVLKVYIKAILQSAKSSKHFRIRIRYIFKPANHRIRAVSLFNKLSSVLNNKKSARFCERKGSKIYWSADKKANFRWQKHHGFTLQRKNKIGQISCCWGQKKAC